MAKDKAGRIDNRIPTYTRVVNGVKQTVSAHYRSNRLNGASRKGK